jgi:hypothetical protein
LVDRSLFALALIALDDLAELVEVGGPHCAQEWLEGTDGIMVGLVQAEVASLALTEEAGIAQHAKVLRDGWPADVSQLGGDVAGGELTLPDEAQDGAPAGRGDGVERCLQLKLQLKYYLTSLN